MTVRSPSGGYYAYATNGRGSNVQTAYSTNLADWQPGADAMPVLPAWARAGRTWAPGVAPLAGARPAEPTSSVFGLDSPTREHMPWGQTRAILLGDGFHLMGVVFRAVWCHI